MLLLLYSLSLILGFVVLVWSANKFVTRSSLLAQHYNLPPLLIGMIIIGFGTSAPELVVSALASYQGNAGIALGNVFGSNITNIALVLGLTAILMPISVHSSVLKKELPILTFVTLLSIGLIYDLSLTRIDAVILLFVFLLLIAWTIWQGLKNGKDSFTKELEVELGELQTQSINMIYLHLVIGLVSLIVSSRILVYGATGIASALGVSDIIIGLTIVAIGTSLPEFVSSIVAARKGEPDIVLGNILGSNLFNILAVLGVSGVIRPLKVQQEILYRDVTLMLVLTLSLLIFGYGLRGKGKINRIEGSILLATYVAYVIYLVLSA